MTPIAELSDVTCRFDGSGQEVLALAAVSLAIASPSLVAVMGATGSGKSTLLNCAAGLERPTSGAVRLLGHDLAGLSERRLARLRRNHVGFVFQSYDLFSDLTVAQNLLVPCRLGARQVRTVADVLDEVRLDGAAERKVGELSGGQRQRVAIGRALMTAPAVIFADEPTGALDPTTGGEVLRLLRRAVDERGSTVVMVTHDPLAASWSDRLVLLRSGRVVDDRATPGAAEIAGLLRAVSTVRAGAGR